MHTLTHTHTHTHACMHTNTCAHIHTTCMQLRAYVDVMGVGVASRGGDTVAEGDEGTEAGPKPGGKGKGVCGANASWAFF